MNSMLFHRNPNAPTDAERSALANILATDARAFAVEKLDTMAKESMRGAPQPLRDIRPGALMTLLYAQCTDRATTWCEAAVHRVHEAARQAHLVIPDRALTRGEQRRRAQPLLSLATDQLFGMCQALVWEVLQREGVVA
jgi:hypothetical protein